MIKTILSIYIKIINLKSIQMKKILYRHLNLNDSILIFLSQKKNISSFFHFFSLFLILPVGYYTITQHNISSDIHCSAQPHRFFTKKYRKKKKLKMMKKKLNQLKSLLCNRVQLCQRPMIPQFNITSTKLVLIGTIF